MKNVVLVHIKGENITSTEQFGCVEDGKFAMKETLRDIDRHCIRRGYEFCLNLPYKTGVLYWMRQDHSKKMLFKFKDVKSN